MISRWSVKPPAAIFQAKLLKTDRIILTIKTQSKRQKKRFLSLKIVWNSHSDFHTLIGICIFSLDFLMVTGIKSILFLLFFHTVCDMHCEIFWIPLSLYLFQLKSWIYDVANIHMCIYLAWARMDFGKRYIGF